ncbi:hypothetical protein G6L26_007625 [Agrobacterium radiobacter]|uniref:Uncharacterized protein n=1 Tax=Agrobacterium tumefaciens str. B6 TaxID=1183423 RepID=A0A822UW10_AGRTU|nr:hypothetical protein [Agrobacterium tumefaciens]KWT88047.1 hypothetical protein ASB65_18620 [Agrobacterium tumefaciens str. B6]MQB28155.1 hypothetical protein [Agrobacterium tumefaciens]NTA05040.1 hypothetical protein [Agrobacterium tumefaciens]NTA91635.1 hypothetical protein [Agrobacterium tumefaciens]NTB12785.1 hypothetical protein [Agrobacterium tumefaciens]
MTALEEIKKAIEEIGPLKVEFTPDGDEYNSIIAPVNDDYDGTFFTVIGCGDKQDKLGGYMALAVNKLPELLSTLESLQRENEELRQDRDRTARNRDMYRGQVERQSAQITMFREEETRLRETLFKCGSFIADRYQEGDTEYQVVLLVNDAICRTPALASTGGEHHAE